LAVRFFQTSPLLFKNYNFKLHSVTRFSPALVRVNRSHKFKTKVQTKIFVQKPRGRGGVILGGGWDGFGIVVWRL
jgi:hypothetical protein